MLRTLDEVKDYLVNTGNEDVKILENPDFATAFIGITSTRRAVYDMLKMIDWLVEKCKMSPSEAVMYICFKIAKDNEDRGPILMSPVEPKW